MYTRTFGKLKERRHLAIRSTICSLSLRRHEEGGSRGCHGELGSGGAQRFDVVALRDEEVATEAPDSPHIEARLNFEAFPQL